MARTGPAAPYWTFFLLGFGLLLPWNALLNAIPYFRQHLASDEGPPGGPGGPGGGAGMCTVGVWLNGGCHAHERPHDVSEHHTMVPRLRALHAWSSAGSGQPDWPGPPGPPPGPPGPPGPPPAMPGGRSAASVVAYALAAAYNAPQPFMQVALVHYGDRLHPLWPLVLGYLLQAVILMVVPLVTWPGVWGLAAISGLCVLSGIGTAIMESSLFRMCAVAGPAAPSMAQAVISGEGLSSLLSTLLAFATHSAPGDASDVDISYFVVASAVMLVCVRSVYKLHKASLANSNSADASITDGAIAGEAAAADSAKVALLSEDPQEEAHDSMLSSDAQAGLLPAMTDHALLVDPPGSSTGKQQQQQQQQQSMDGQPGIADKAHALDDTAPAAPASAPATYISLLSLLADVWPTVLGLWLVMLVNFLLFPGVVADITYTGDNGDFNSDPGLWTLTLFLCNSVGDLTGRAFIAGLQVHWFKDGASRVQATWILVYSCLRLAFIPTLLVDGRQDWFGSDAYSPVSAVLVLGLGFTSGHASSLAMMAGPMLAPAHARGKAATVHVLALITGLCMGSMAALLLGPTGDS